MEHVAGWIQFWHAGYWQDKLSRSYPCSRGREESATHLRKAMADVPLEQVAPFLSMTPASVRTFLLSYAVVTLAQVSLDRLKAGLNTVFPLGGWFPNC